MMQGGSQYHIARPTCGAPNSLPGRTVQVTVGDMGMMQTMSGTAPITAVMRLQATPATAPAGQISFVVTNSGWRTHEMVILSLAPGAAAGQRTPGSDGKVSETGSLGEASSGCAAGPGTGITSGSVGWVTATLAPGRYELLCNLANHYADGMRQAIVIG
jgi:uncharacterized cupredoxin-like copper-binding protein